VNGWKSERSETRSSSLRKPHRQHVLQCSDEISKYTTPAVDRKEGKFSGIQVNYAGNHKKSLKHSLEASLIKLRTDYIDILYVHWWDYSTPIEEVMQSLNELVRSGKVLYLGVSDTPAWIVAQANEYARAHGMAQFVV
jgi:aryl-alcohol dehydrogenase-like predicted oxidoreductase